MLRSCHVGKTERWSSSSTGASLEIYTNDANTLNLTSKMSVLRLYIRVIREGRSFLIFYRLTGVALCFRGCKVRSRESKSYWNYSLSTLRFHVPHNPDIVFLEHQNKAKSINEFSISAKTNVARNEKRRLNFCLSSVGCTRNTLSDLGF